MLNKTFLIGTSTFATGSWHTVPRLPRRSAPRVSFELLRLHVMVSAIICTVGKLQAEVPAGAAGWKPRDATALPTAALHCGLWDTALPARSLAASGKGDGLPCCRAEQRDLLGTV